jgi:hypothetical protein
MIHDVLEGPLTDYEDSDGADDGDGVDVSAVHWPSGMPGAYDGQQVAPSSGRTTSDPICPTRKQKRQSRSAR